MQAIWRIIYLFFERFNLTYYDYCYFVPSVLFLHMDEQMDSKTLIGSYTCTERPGEFKWQPGSLTQVCIILEMMFFSTVASLCLYPKQRYKLLISIFVTGSCEGTLGCLWGYRQSPIWSTVHLITFVGRFKLFCYWSWRGNVCFSV